jgi:hypothetical protein
MLALRAEPASGAEAAPAADAVLLPGLPPLSAAATSPAARAAAARHPPRAARHAPRSAAAMRSLGRDAACRVPGCALSSLKEQGAYFVRSRLCSEHVRAEALTVDGQLVRFCQKVRGVARGTRLQQALRS